MTMTIGQVQILRDSAAEAGDSEASGGNYFPRVVVKLADAALGLHAQLQQEREGREKLETAVRNLIKANWANYGRPENEFIAYQTSGTGRERIQTEWLALDAALTQADSGRD